MAAPLPIMYRGEDKNIPIELADANDAPLVISTLTGVIVTIYDERETIVEKFSVNPMVGYSSISVDDDVNGKISLTLSAASTRPSTVKAGVLYIDVKVRITPLSTLDSIYVDELTILKNAVSKNETTFA